jgi:hypothetical protein
VKQKNIEVKTVPKIEGNERIPESKIEKIDGSYVIIKKEET